MHVCSYVYKKTLASYLLDNMCSTEYEKLARKNRTFVDETFGGILSSTVICRDCFTVCLYILPFIALITLYHL